MPRFFTRPAPRAITGVRAPFSGQVCYNPKRSETTLFAASRTSSFELMDSATCFSNLSLKLIDFMTRPYFVCTYNSILAQKDKNFELTTHGDAVGFFGTIAFAEHENNNDVISSEPCDERSNQGSKL